MRSYALFSLKNMPTATREVYVGQPVQVLYEWLNERVGLAWSDDFKAIGRVIGDELVGVVGFTGFNGASMQMHMAGASKHWITRKFIREAFRYAFETCGCKVVFGLVPSGNTVALGIDHRLGFKEVAMIPGAHPDGGLHFLVLRREDCRWV